MADAGRSGADQHSELPQVFTETAHRRTQLANERTFSARVATAIRTWLANESALIVFAGPLHPERLLDPLHAP
jgi:uncharacterized membrane protein YidH (DUF202 family)